MSLGATALGDAALGSTAGTEQTATASLAASDGDRSTAAGTRGVAAATTAADADRATTVGTLGVAGVVTAADAGAGALAGVRTLAATTLAQDADAGSLAAQTDATQTAVLAAGDADAGTLAGERTLAATTLAQDADAGSLAAQTGAGQGAALAVGDADAGALAGVRTRLATPTGADADVSAVGVVNNPTTRTLTRPLDWRETVTRPIDIDSMHEITAVETTQGESLRIHFPITKDGDEYDASTTDLRWYLLPLGGSAPADAVRSDSEAGVTLSVSDADGDGTSERVTLEIDQDVTDGLDGYYRQLLVLDDSGPGLDKQSGQVHIEDI